MLRAALLLALTDPVEAPAELPPVEVTAQAPALAGALDALPASVSRVGRDALATAQYQVNLSESLARVPGLVVNNRQNYAQDLQLSLRGFGARAAFGVRGLRLYTDAIPATMPDGQGQVGHFDLATAESASVLRGPFSALYGASSGGAIELTTLAPERDFVAASGWRAAEAAQRYAASGALARDSWNLLGSGSWFDTAGFREHSAATRGGAQARLGAGNLVALANVMDLSAQDPLGLTRAQWEADPRQAGSNALAYDTRKTVRQSQAGAVYTPRFGTGALRLVAWGGTRETRQYQSIPDTVQGTLADNPTHPGGVIDLERAYYGTDLRWSAQRGALGFALGVDAEFMDERRQGFQNFTGTPGPASTKGVPGPKRRDEDNRAAAVDPYAQAHWRFAPGWTALAGLRRANVRFESDDRFIVAGNGDDSGSARFDAWLPVAGVRYAPGAWAWHLAASRGAETPTLNELAYRPDGSAGLNDALRSSRSRNFEAGARWRDAGRMAELVLFTIGTTDEIVVAASSGGRTSFRNASGTRRDGVEAVLRWPLAPGLDALASYTWIDARYDEDFASGNRLPGVPRHSAFAELAWRGGGPGISVALEGLHRSDVSVNDSGSDAAPSYVVLNLRAAWALPGGLELFARADNLLDRRYIGSVIVNEAQGRYFEPAPGRGLGAGLRWGFGAAP